MDFLLNSKLEGVSGSQTNSRSILSGKPADGGDQAVSGISSTGSQCASSALNHGAMNQSRQTQNRRKSSSSHPSQQNRTPQSKYETFDNIFGSKSFPKYYCVKPKTDCDLTKLNMFKVDREIRNNIGQYSKLTEDYSNKSWTVEVKSEEQGHRLMTLSSLVDVPVEVSLHERFNESQGVITCSILKNYSEADIVEGLAEHGVVRCHRIIRNARSANPEPTATLILTFNLPQIPDRLCIRAGLYERVRPYIPNPRRCTNCQRYGHSHLKCRREIPVCERCGGDCTGDHSPTTCQLPLNCIHCKAPHSSSSRVCSKYLMEKEIIAVKTKERISFSEARSKVMTTFHHSNRTYASATAPSTSQEAAATVIPATFSLTQDMPPPAQPPKRSTDRPLNVDNTPSLNTKRPLRSHSSPLSSPGASPKRPRRIPSPAADDAQAVSCRSPPSSRSHSSEHHRDPPSIRPDPSPSPPPEPRSRASSVGSTEQHRPTNKPYPINIILTPQKRSHKNKPNKNKTH